MRIVKITILQNESKLRPGDFIRKIREGIVGRIRAFRFAFEPLSDTIIKRRKINFRSDDQIEEIWANKKKKRSYFEPGKVSTSQSLSNRIPAIPPCSECLSTSDRNPSAEHKPIGKMEQCIMLIALMTNLSPLKGLHFIITEISSQ